MKKIWIIGLVLILIAGVTAQVIINNMDFIYKHPISQEEILESIEFTADGEKYTCEIYEPDGIIDQNDFENACLNETFDNKRIVYNVEVKP